MTQRPRRSSARRPGPTRRAGKTASLVWRGLASASISSTSIAGQLAIEIIDPSVDDYADATILRIIGRLTLSPEAINANVMWRYGLVTVEGDAVGAGGIPDPWADATNWMYEDGGWIRTSVVNDPASVVSIPIDVRVNRRLPQERVSLFSVLENLPASTAALASYQVLKVLLRIP